MNFSGTNETTDKIQITERILMDASIDIVVFRQTSNEQYKK